MMNNDIQQEEVDNIIKEETEEVSKRSREENNWDVTKLCQKLL